MKRHVLTVLVIGSLCLGCGEKEAIVVSELETPVVTGYYLRDGNGYPYSTVGVPNTRLVIDPVLPFEGSMSSYPNPAAGAVFLTVWGRPGQRAKLWLARAVFEGELVARLSAGAPLLQVSNLSGYQYDLRLGEYGSTIYVDARELPAGYYRVYARLGDELLWDNLFITKN